MRDHVRHPTGPVQALTARPLYSQVKDLLMERIKSFEWIVGESMPNETILATQFAVSVGTIRRAVAELQDIGIVKRIQGKGTYIVGIGSCVLQEKFNRLATPTGERANPRYELLSVQNGERSAEAAAQLCLSETASMIAIEQLLRMDGGVVGYEQSLLPSAKFPRLEAQINFGQHVYPLLTEFGTIVTRCEESITVAVTRPDIAAHLGVEADESVLMVRRVAFDAFNEPVEHRTAAYNSKSVAYLSTI